jgi:hypothetical protein
MIGDISGILQKIMSIPKAGDGAFPTSAVGNSMEIGCVRVAPQKPILAAPLPPVNLLAPVDLYKGVFKGISPKPLLGG